MADDPRLDAYLDLLMHWNRAVNLVSRRATRGDVKEQLINPVSKAVIAVGPLTGRLVDVGAGSGMGGILFALSNPALHVTFVERVKKKAAFIKEVSREVGLGSRTRVIDRGFGEVGWETCEFDSLYARAVGAVGSLLETMRPAIATGGRVFLLERPSALGPSGWRLVREADVGGALALHIYQAED